MVWLDAMSDGAPRAGDLCTRHADAMAPPKGWDRIDRRVLARPEPVSVVAAVVEQVVERGIEVGTHDVATDSTQIEQVTDDLLPKESLKKRRKKKRWEEVPSLFVAGSDAGLDSEPESAAPVVPLPVEPEPEVASTTWLPRFATDDDLDGVLDASTPLLARAFGHARPSTTTRDSDRDK